MKKKEIKSAEIVGEFTVGETHEISVDWNGYNYLIIYGSQVFQLDLVMTSIVLLCLFSTVLYKGIGWLEKRAR